MRWPALLAWATALCVVAGAGQAGAQSTLGAPTVGAITATTNTLTVPWSAPADDGGSAITAYDVRYIRTGATAAEKQDDDNWTVEEGIWSSGTLEYTVTGLVDGVGYDVQVRAENANGKGPSWSATVTGATTDHADTIATATALALSSSLPGSLDPADDEDVFSIVLTSAADLWVYTTGDTPTVGKLLNSSGGELKEALATTLLDAPRGFALRSELSAGTYYVRVSSYRAREAGSYTIHAQTVTDPGNTIASATPVTLDSATPGRIGPEAGGSVDTDVYQLVLNASTDIWVMAIGEHEGAGDAGPLDTVGELLDSDGSQLTENDDSKFPNNEKGFMLRRTLRAGTYYIRVQGYGSRHIGPYTLHLRTAADPGSTTATAAPLTLRVPETGRISPRDDRDYFSLTLAEETYVFIVAMTFGSALPLTSTILDDEGNTVTAHVVTHADYVGRGRSEVSFTVRARLDAGTYHLRVRRAGSATGRYLLVPFVSADGVVAKRCTDITTAQSDPWYGCQWHLKNTGQFGSGALQDINVESVWTSGNRGAGVNVVVVDDGLHSGHEDLTDNVLTARNHDYASQGGVYDAFATHGTSVAGIIAARDNEIGVRGVAPRAKIFAYNIAARGISVSDHEANAMFRGEDADHTAVSSNSWGFPDTGSPNNAKAAWERAVERGVTEGYGGKGIFYVWAAGNGHVSRDDNSNLDGRANFHAVTAVCAIGYDDVRSSYSEMGANLWVCAPSNSGRAGSPSITTTKTGHGYRDDFRGTSAAVPIVSGVAALVRAANTSLTWRAVKLILAASARRNDTGNSGWQEGALEYGSATDRYRFNHEYGFGVVDAAAAVALAVDDRWAGLPSQRSTGASSGSLGDPPGTGLAILDGSITTSSVTLDHHVGFVEFMQIEVKLTHEWFRDLRIELVSPAGNVSVLSVPSSMAGPSLFSFSSPRFEGTYRFGSAKHLGESAAGAWTLFISDHQLGDSGVLKSWKLKAYGHGHTPGYPSITTVDPGRGSFDVTWSAPDDIGGSDITSYDIGYILTDDPDPTNWTEVTNVGSTSALQHTLSGLKGDAEFHLAVRAVNDAGAGPWSDSFTEETEQSVPNRPGSVVAAARDGGLAVSWGAPSYVGVGSPTSYDVRYIRNDASDKADALWTSTSPAWATGGGDLRYVIRNLENGVLYDVQVLARNDAGPGEWSRVTTGTPAAINSPAQFPNIEAGLRSVIESIPAGVDIGEPVAARDDESDTLTYSLTSGGATFHIVAMTGQLQTKAALDHERTPRHTVTVAVHDGRASDGTTSTAIDDTITVTITVTDVEEAPEFPSATAARSVDENTSPREPIGDAVTAADDDGDSLTYSLAGTDASFFAINASSGQIETKAALDFETKRTHTVVVGVSDRKDVDGEPVAETVPDIDDTVVVTITVTDVNEPPSVHGLESVDIAENTSGVLTTYRAVDPEGVTDFEWSLSGTDASAFEISETPGSNGALSFAQPPDFETPLDNGRDNVYNVTVEASDGTRTGRRTVVVTVSNLEETPAFPSSRTTRSVDEDLAVGQDVGMAVTASDGDRDALSYSLATPSAIFEIDPASGQLRTTAALDHETERSHTVIVRVSDGKDADGNAVVASNDIDDTITVTITVNDVEETPEFPSASTTRRVDEDLAVGQNVGAPVEASDGDGDTLTYSLPTASSVFAIDSSSGQLRTRAALDHETTSVHVLVVRVSDGKDANGDVDSAIDDTITVTITITNLDEPGTVTVTPNQPQVGTRLTASLSDPDGGISGRSWQWQVRESGAWSDVAGATSGRYTPVAADEGKRLRVTASYTDGHDSGKTATRTLTDPVRAAPVTNSAPEFPSSSTTRSVPENTPAGRSIGDPVEASDDDGDDLTYTLDRASRNLFDIGAGGQLRTRAALDHEARSSYSVTVTATDRSGASDTISVRIDVADVEEAPAFDAASTTRGVAENTPAGRPIGDPVAATDGDRDALTYSLGGADAASFAIDASSGRLRTRAALDHETRASYSLTVRVSDRTNADGEPVDETDPDIDDTISVTIGVGDVEEAPFFDSASTTRSVAENTPRGEDIGAPVEATDDDGDALSYSLTGAGAASFAIDASSGHIETRAPLDFETGPNTYSVTVRVSDRMSAGGEPVADTVPDIDDSIAVTITVTNVNEAPTLSGRERINAREIATIEVTTYEAVDPEHDDLTWSLSGTDSDDFTISSTGELAFRTLPDFEQPADFDGNNVYHLTVRVFDGKDANGNTDSVIDATLDVTVTVTNVGEVGEITVSPGPARVGVTLTASLSDPDGGVTNLTWQWQISASGASWSDVAGATSAGYTPRAADEGRFLRVSAAYSDDQARATTAEATLAGAVQSAPNTPPRFRASSTSRSVPENTAARQNIGAPVTATDSDGDTLSYSLGGADAASFAIVASSGQLQTRNALDFETPRIYSVSVSVSDGKDADGNPDSSSDHTISVTISVSDVNEPPVFPGTLRTALSVDENTPAGQDIGDPLAAGDEDAGSTLTYSLAGADAASFAIVASSGQLQTSAALDFETRSSYSLSVSVSDGHDANGDEDNTADASIAVTVTVNDLEEDGAISVPSDQPQVGAALTASLSDPDRGVTGVTWQWQVSDDQSAWSDIKTATSASYTPEASDENRYLRVTASYSDRRGSGKQAETSLPNPVQAAPSINRPPQFPAPSTSRSVPENTPRGEDIGTPIAAADNDVLRYSLSGTHASSFSIDQNTGQLRTNAALDYETRRSYSVTVTATDPSATSDSIAVTINVTDLNEPPAFPTSPRAPLSVDENTAAGRNIGSPLTAIDEDDGDSLIYSLDSASDAFFDIDPDKGLLRTEAPLNHEATDSYRVVVQVSDGDDAGGKPDPAIDDTLTLTVRVTDRNEPPVVSGEASISYAEDRTDPVATYAHNDPDENASITWSLSGPDAGDFAIDGSGVLSFAGPPDHDDPRDSNGDNEYHVTVSASDGSLRDSLDVTVTVSGVNERPQLSGPAAVSYREDRTDAVASYAHNDPDQPPTITWSLAGDDGARFAISAAGVLSFREAPNHERARDANRENDYELTVTASDGSLDDSLDVTVTVTDVNEPPTLTGRTSITVDEHAERFVAGYSAADPDADAALGWTLGGADATHFELTADGELRFRLEPDYEAGRNNVYNVIVRVFDGANTPALSVTVTVANVDEPGEITLGSLQPQVGTAVSAALSDPDGSLSGRSWQWQLSGDRNDWSDIAGATAASYTPVAADEGRFLRVTASYTDGHGPGKTAATALDAVRAAPAASNTPPAFPASESGRRFVPENTPAAQPIGDPVGAVDDDPGDTTALTYSLDVASDTVFDIVADTGQLLTEKPLNREARGSYTVTVTVSDPSTAVASIRVTITVEDVDEPPELSGDTVVSVPENSGRPVATYSATDPERTPLIWRLEGRDAGAFDLVDGVLSFLAPPDFESPANVAGSNTYLVTIVVSDGDHSPTLDIAVIVTDVDESASGPSPVLRGLTGGGGGGGGGGPSGPTPSTVDFEWTVTRDVEALDPGNDWPTDLWSDGRVLWIAENGPGADDEIYAYDLATGERLEDAEFELDETNRAPRGFWSDGETVWVSDSGQDRLFAYDLESGERLEAREFELTQRNRDPRGIWSGGVTMWVLDGRRDALFGYDLASGVLLGEYALASSNGDPHGVWSDGVTVWVSDHGAKRLFAYRLPAAPEGPAADDADVTALERVGSEEFAELSKASNNSPRGLWSDGAVMYVADESDDRVYSYNLPDAIDARLASLTLSGVEIGEFSAATRHYGGLPGEEVTETTVEATAVQSGASVVVEPADADVETEGHQVGVDGGAEVTVTVTSPDGSRGRVYRVTLGESGASASCLRGDVAVGFSLLLYEGGSVDELVACAESRHVRTLYGGTTVPYVIGAPGFVNRSFVARFAAGLPAGTPLLATSEGPASPDPAGGVPGNIPPAPWPECLRGDGAPGFSLVLYEGGSVEELVECAASRGVSALYTLDDGEWVSYIAGAPEFVNRPFRELFAAGVPAVTPLLARGN